VVGPGPGMKLKDARGCFAEGSRRRRDPGDQALSLSAGAKRDKPSRGPSLLPRSSLVTTLQHAPED
jgi:hypothetical protein